METTLVQPWNVDQYSRIGEISTEYCQKLMEYRQRSKRQSKNQQLQPNPFTTYRDPETGRWMVIKSVVA